VDDDVEPAEVGGGAVDGSRTLGRVGGVGLDRPHGGAGGGELRDELVGVGGRGGVRERDGGTVGGEPSHDLGTDAARSSGDQCPTAGQVCSAHVDASLISNRCVTNYAQVKPHWPGPHSRV